MANIHTSLSRKINIFHVSFDYLEVPSGWVRLGIVGVGTASCMVPLKLELLIVRSYSVTVDGLAKASDRATSCHARGEVHHI